MRVLVGCEESQAVCIAFREKGHEAYSCDVQPCSGGHPEWHLQMDVFEAIEKYGPWDLLIAHPPCTFICRHRSRWKEKRNHALAGKNFFNALLNVRIPKICIENPVPLLKWKLQKYSQIIQPYQFGHDYSKKTCLWLIGLPKLKSTKNVVINKAAEAERVRQLEEANRIKAEKKAARAPDRVKLNILATHIYAFEIPEVKSPEAQIIIKGVKDMLNKIGKYIDKQTEQL